MHQKRLIVLTTVNCLRNRSKGLSLYTNDFLSYWYASQEYVLKWGTSFSTSSRVTNGRRQGGLISSILYNMYTNELNERLKES